LTSFEFRVSSYELRVGAENIWRPGKSPLIPLLKGGDRTAPLRQMRNALQHDRREEDSDFRLFTLPDGFALLGKSGGAFSGVFGS
jgi:hypothetical protein